MTTRVGSRMRDTGDRYDSLLQYCYEAVLDPTAWQRLLPRLMDATGHQQVALLFWNTQSTAGQISLDYQLNADAADASNGYSCHLDPTRVFMERRAVGNWYHSRLDLGIAHMRQDPVHQEYQLPHGMASVSCVKLYESAHTRLFLSLLLSTQAPKPSPAQHRLLTRLTPHLRRAAQLSARMADLEWHAAQRDLLLERQPVAMWLLEVEGRVIYCNTHAERAMRQANSPLHEVQGHLQCRGQNKQLQQAIQKAGGQGGSGCSNLLRFAQPEGMELLVTPLAADAPFNLCQRPLILLAVLSNGLQKALLVDLFQLTPAELSLVALLTQGHPPEHCALQLGVSINTVRSQLRSLYRKTGTERQGELIGLVARLSR